MDADDLLKAATHAADMLTTLGVEGDERTAMRLVRAIDELASARDLDPVRHLATRFPPTAEQPGLVVVTDIPFTSLCEHHMLPFTGVATVAYLPRPGQTIAGLSKLARVVQEYAARPQVQERLTDQVVAALHLGQDSAGAAVAVRGAHSCMALRGARTGSSAAMVTVQYAGDLGASPWRDQFDRLLSTAAWRG